MFVAFIRLKNMADNEQQQPLQLQQPTSNHANQNNQHHQQHNHHQHQHDNPFVGLGPTAEEIASNSVSEVEIDWMLAQRPLVSDHKQRVIDFGEKEAGMIDQAFAAESPSLQPYLACLAWPGVGTRWRQFLSWLRTHLSSLSSSPTTGQTQTPNPASSHDEKETQPNVEQSKQPTPRDVFAAFAGHLGRVKSWRCLALSKTQYLLIKSKDSIWPTGRLKTTAEDLRSLVNEEGVRKVAFARLYIGMRLIGPVDPSLSLHDDPETAVCIASGYAGSAGVSLRLFHVSVPLVETLGYAVVDLHLPESRRWFEHRGVWFDAQLYRTERYLLYEIPFLSRRLLEERNMKETEVAPFLAGFKESQLAKMQAWEASSSASSSSSATGDSKIDCEMEADQEANSTMSPSRGLEEDDPLVHLFRKRDHEYDLLIASRETRKQKLVEAAAERRRLEKERISAENQRMQERMRTRSAASKAKVQEVRRNSLKALPGGSDDADVVMATAAADATNATVGSVSSSSSSSSPSSSS